jgi:formylglycine-generating enzyme required for sulfatase activity
MLNTALILAAGCTLWQGAPVEITREPFVQKIEGTLVSFRMMPLPDGAIELQGKRRPVECLWIGETEVTWNLYDVWAHRLDLSEEEVLRGAEAESRPSRPYGAPDRGFGHSGYAALGMTFHAAQSFCTWLSAKTGKKYRLPTEAEWEYAARAGGPVADLDAHAWYWDNADDKTHPVGKKRPNAWGIFDMLGNVSEWTVGLDGEPVACGGSFADKARDVGPAARFRQTPAWNATDPQNPKSKWWLSDAPFVGFRVVCEG